ncbi:Cysteine-rich protein [Phytophthora cinnamomi]|uniref:Cysteine-rich protein n=1 Tax=Phytophthora cinnamomi TaxID=4785 RepID=UPI00355A9A5C|nr:Cysteine-rich protein [Phytophthora cinnamomi]
MKFSTVFTAAVVAVVCLLQPSAAEDQASVHLRVHTVEQSPNGAICYKACPSGQYCPRGENACRAPTGKQCFNPATSLFINGCDRGFKCSNGKCVYA